MSPRPCGVVSSRDEEGSEGVLEREPPPPEANEPSAEGPLLPTDFDFWSVACRRMTGGRAGGGKPFAHRFLATRDE